MSIDHNDKAARYFDWAATAIPDPEIQQKALETSLCSWENPSSIHSGGKTARKTLEDVRAQAAKNLGVKPETIFFTSGGTESDFIPLTALLSRPVKGSVVLSAIEHPAIREMAKALSNCGYTILTVNPDKNGIIQPEAVIEKVQPDTAFVTVMAVNNETGAIQPIKEIAQALVQSSSGRKRPHFHVDCVQALGKIPLALNVPGIDSAAFSAHKIGGPRGIGILYLTKEIVPFMRGGGQEKGIRSGTENLFGAAAFAACIQKYAVSQNNTKSIERFEQQKAWTQEFISALEAIPSCTLIPHSRSSMPDAFSPWIVQASFKGIPGQVMQRALDAKGFAISTGSACSSGRHSRPVLDSMNVSGPEKEGAVRFSFGDATSREGMMDLLKAVTEITEDFAS